MSSLGPPTQRVKRKTPDAVKSDDRPKVRVLSLNVQGVDGDELGQAIQATEPDIIALQEFPKTNNAFRQKLAVYLAASSIDYRDETTEEFFKPSLTFPDKSRVVAYSDTSTKSYRVFYNATKLQVLKPMQLVNYAQDTSRKDEVSELKDSKDASDMGFGARPPAYVQFKFGSSKKIGLFTHHAPTFVDLHHHTSIQWFEESEKLAESKSQNHMTIIAADMNDKLQLSFKEFKEGVSHNFDHIIAHKASGHKDLLKQFPQAAKVCTKSQDHFLMLADIYMDD